MRRDAKLPPAMVSDRDLLQLYEHVDADRNGEVELEELVTLVEGGAGAGASPQEEAQGARGPEPAGFPPAGIEGTQIEACGAAGNTPLSIAAREAVGDLLSIDGLSQSNPPSPSPTAREGRSAALEDFLAHLSFLTEWPP